jgi:hypothetical protein
VLKLQRQPCDRIRARLRCQETADLDGAASAIVGSSDPRKRASSPFARPGFAASPLRHGLRSCCAGLSARIPPTVRLCHIGRRRTLSVAVLAIIETILRRSRNAEGGAVAITLDIRAAAEWTRAKFHVTHFAIPRHACPGDENNQNVTIKP